MNISICEIQILQQYSRKYPLNNCCRWRAQSASFSIILYQLCNSQSQKVRQIALFVKEFYLKEGCLEFRELD